MISHDDSRANAPALFSVGVPDEVVAGLRERLPDIEVQGVPGDELSWLPTDDSALVIVGHLLDGPPGIELVTRIRARHGDVTVLYVLDRRLDSVVGRELIGRLDVHGPVLYPVDDDALARAIREVLHLPAPPIADALAEPQQTESEVHGVQMQEPVEAAAPRSNEVRRSPSRSMGAEMQEASTNREASLDAGRPAGSSPSPVPGHGTDVPDGHYLLLVDDSTDITDRIFHEARARGIRVEVCCSVLDARIILARERPDAVLLDLTLCNSTDEGLTLLEELDGRVGQLPALDGSVPRNADGLSIPVVFLAERDSFIDRVQAVSLGGRGFLPKTASPSDILRAVTRLLQQLHATESRVLAVDDDPQVLADLRALLEPKGIKLTTLSDPLRFWTTLEASVPDLLMVDFDLPRWSGLELCKVVRNDTRWSALPVLCLTSNADSDTVQRVFDAGADDFVSKPIIGPELVTKVANRLQRIQLYRIMAEIDPLTGVANRLRATEALDRLLRLAKRQNQPLSLAILDLDNFKQINDRFGHGTGDEALRRVGSLLARTFRTEDVVARFGGEEFIVGMYGMPRIDGVQRLSRLLESLREETPQRMRNDGVTLTFSAGVAQYPEDGLDLDALREAADRALYGAKQAGKDQVLPAGGQDEADGEGQNEITDVVVVTGDDDGASIVGAVRELGFRVQWIGDGEAAALRVGTANPSIEAPVILLDLELPVLGGTEVLRRWALHGVLNRSRVIVLGEQGNERATRKAIEMGAFGQLLRPLSLATLQQRVRQALSVP